MLGRILFFLHVFAIFPFTLSASGHIAIVKSAPIPECKQTSSIPPVSSPKLMNYLIEPRIACFYPMGDDFRNVYTGNALYGVEFDVRAWREVHVWVATNYFTTSGKTVEDQTKTSVTLVPSSLGAKYIYERFCIQPYLGAGLLVSYVQAHVDEAEYLIGSQSKWGAGGIFKMGCLCKVQPYLAIDLFIDYLLQYIRMGSSPDKPVVLSTVNVSGFAFGVGGAYRF